MPNSPLWLTVEDVRAIHDYQLSRYGGARGLHSLALLESAVASPLNHFYYAKENSALYLGAVLAHAIVKDHPFTDGNKRTAMIAMLEFLHLNGLTLVMADTPDRQPLAAAIEELASSMITMSDFVERVRPFLQSI